MTIEDKVKLSCKIRIEILAFLMSSSYFQRELASQGIRSERPLVCRESGGEVDGLWTERKKREMTLGSFPWGWFQILLFQFPATPLCLLICRLFVFLTENRNPQCQMKSDHSQISERQGLDKRPILQESTIGSHSGQAKRLVNVQNTLK